MTAAPRPHAAPPDPTGTEVLVAGPASWNLLVRLDELPAPTPHTVFARSSHHAVGGTSAGKALNLARLGRTVLLRTVLGSDDEAEHVRSVLAREGVRVVEEPSPDGRTESHLNLLDDDGGRVSVYLRAPGEVPAVGASWDVTTAALDAAAAVVVDLAVPALPVLDLAVARGRDVWVDLCTTTTAGRRSTGRGSRPARTSSSAGTGCRTGAASCAPGSTRARGSPCARTGRAAPSR
ncbi:PfkB family carbohydrate kinase [Cellulosimicrobium composti]|uniref:PfkB family carbohydrate kinase n=1 Tax=Cellulosimicrobium composti TaxID=2672572 RepID=UPI00298EB707|nr:PfkB family carbohydrate kinase [Cellulosimicrobium composti]